MRRLNNHKKLRKDSAYAFDAAWIIALALNASFANGMRYEKLLNRGFKEVFAIKNGIQNANFDGITVSNSFSWSINQTRWIYLKITEHYDLFHNFYK